MRNLGASRGPIQAHQACSSSKTVVRVLLDTYHNWKSQSFQHIYLGCFPYDRLAVLDHEAKMWLMSGESQRLRTNAPANIDNQRALREVFPGVPCKSNFSKSDIGLRRCVASPDPHGWRSSSQRACFFCCSWQLPIE